MNIIYGNIVGICDVKRWMCSNRLRLHGEIGVVAVGSRVVRGQADAVRKTARRSSGDKIGVFAGDGRHGGIGAVPACVVFSHIVPVRVAEIVRPERIPGSIANAVGIGRRAPGYAPGLVVAATGSAAVVAVAVSLVQHQLAFIDGADRVIEIEQLVTSHGGGRRNHGSILVRQLAANELTHINPELLPGIEQLLDLILMPAGVGEMGTA